MNLPQLKNEISFIKVALPSGRTIGVRGWKVKDEKELMFALDAEEDIEDKKITHIINFLRNCVDNQATFDLLSEQDLKKVTLEIRKLSKGDSIEYNYQCPNCSSKLFDEVRLSKAEVVKPFNHEPLVLNESISFLFKDIPYKEADILFEKYKDSEAKYTYYFLLSSIEAITHEGTVYDKFSVEELDEWIGNLNSDDLDKLYTTFEEKVSEVKLEKKLTCIKCKEVFPIEYGNLFSFLVS